MNLKSKLKKYLLYSLIAFIVLVGIGLVFSEPVPEQAQVTKSQDQQETQVRQVEPARYEVIQEEDISYLGCKRVTYRIAVPDSASQESVDLAMKRLIDEKKAQWGDITVWAYKNSEKERAASMAYTMGIKEYSTCG